MFSNFSGFNSFLPSVLHRSPAQSNPQINLNDDDDEQEAEKSKQSESAKKEEEGKKEKERKVNETFIFVRPPPAKSNHPLNIQVQLVPPHTRAPGVGPRQSIDSTSDAVSVESGAPLARTASNRSDYSSSTASFMSVSSTASGRRMIIPLYNLQAHNVLTNTIVDAGTDAKIARFGKRGIEMMELVNLEPVEVWAAREDAGDIVRLTREDSILNNQRANSLLVENTSRPSSRPTTPNSTTPGSSAISLSSSTGSHPHPPLSTAAALDQPAKKKDNLFGRMFKKKPEPLADTTPTKADRRISIQMPPILSPSTPKRHSRNPSNTTPSYLTVSHPSSPAAKRLSLASVSSHGGEKEQEQAAGPPIPSQILLPPTLGIQPLLNISIPPPPNPPLLASLAALFTSSAYPPSFTGIGRNPFIGRGPAMYVWTVRRWIKGDGNSVLAGMLMGTTGRPGAGDGVDLRVEWRRGKSGRKSKVKTKRRATMNTTDGLSENDEVSSLGERARRRISTLSVSSRGSTQATSRSVSRARPEESDGEESDPEDSETPWTCTLKLKPVVSTAKPAVSPIKLKVATLSPTPHHPKVVAMLKVPYPLPDVDVENMRVVKRVLVEGEGRRVVSQVNEGGLVLTAEEIKDVVCSTGLWLVVREGFGGVGKVSRKGDGWRIRA